MQLPIPFTIETKTSNNINDSWSIEASGHTVNCSIPPEFSGPGGAPSPEDLFVSALVSCFVGTFKVYCHNSKVQFTNLKVKAQLSVDLNQDKKTVMKSCHMQIEILGASNPDRLLMLTKKTFASGFILNSVSTEITYEIRFI